jgi:uncharacterized membrane protein
MNDPRRPGRSVAVPVAALATAATMLVLDLTWLGVVAREFYNSELAPLRRPEVFLPAAGLFYALYLAAILVHAVLGASTPAGAARRGVALGLVAYGTYEFTNWAVLRDWPVRLVLVDLVWGVVLTAMAAFVGRWVYDAMRTGSRG